MSKPIIRMSNLDDKLAVKDAHIRSIRQVCSKDYKPQQIESWAQPLYAEDGWVKSVNKQHHQVVELNGKIEGFCHSTVHKDGTGEILGLYLTPEVIGLGVGREIAKIALDYIHKHDPTKLVVCATVTARPFYERMGFRVVGEQSFFDIRGAKIECYHMELAPSLLRPLRSKTK